MAKTRDRHLLRVNLLDSRREKPFFPFGTEVSTHVQAEDEKLHFERIDINPLFAGFSGRFQRIEWEIIATLSGLSEKTTCADRQTGEHGVTSRKTFVKSQTEDVPPGFQDQIILMEGRYRN